MNLTDAKQLARQLMNEHGANDIPLVISGGKRQLGVCCWNKVPRELLRTDDVTALVFGYRRKRRTRQSKIERYKNATCKCIKLSRYLVALNNENEIQMTMLHEIAHFIVGAGHGHDTVWRRKALEIGCDGKRINRTAEMPEGRYKATCQCGDVYYKHRKGKNVLRANLWRCKKCNHIVQFVDTFAIA